MTATAGRAAAAPASTPAALTVVDVLGRAGAEVAVGVPDSQLDGVLAAMAARMPVEFTLREDIAVAAAVGAGLAGRLFAVFMKNAGLGTSLDAIVSLSIAAEVPIVLVVGWAGAGTDTLPHHVVMGRRTRGLLDAIGVPHDVVTGDGDDPARLAGRWAGCLRDQRPYALLVRP